MFPPRGFGASRGGSLSLGGLVIGLCAVRQIRHPTPTALHPIASHMYESTPGSRTDGSFTERRTYSVDDGTLLTALDHLEVLANLSHVILSAPFDVQNVRRHADEARDRTSLQSQRTETIATSLERMASKMKREPSRRQAKNVAVAATTTTKANPW
jgi:hypothetical protein